MKFRNVETFVYLCTYNTKQKMVISCSCLLG